MKTNTSTLNPVSLALALWWVSGPLPLWASFPTQPEDYRFVYQGYFTDNNQPAHGTYDLSFRLLGEQYRVVAGGGPMWSNTDFMRPAAGWTVEDVRVEDGQFQVEIDFGPAVVFDGSVRFLEVAVRPGASTGEFRILAPPHRLLPVPKALHANTADAVIGLLSISNLPPAVAWLDRPQVFTAPPTFNPPSGVPFVVGLTDTVQRLSADLLDGLDSSAFWRRATSDGVSGIVEPEDRPVEIRVQNTPVLRLQKGDSNLGWSMVAGSAGNTVAAGVPGAVVGGGRGNSVATGAHYSSVLGGDGNTVGLNARDSVIGGGSRQLIGPNSIHAGVFAGSGNLVSSNSRFAGVLLGSNGKVRENSDFSAIVSGGDNTLGPATYSVILAGGANRIESGANLSLIASGQQNTISTQAYQSAIVSGQLNRIGQGAQRSVVGGGDYNEVGPASYNAFLGGGERNQIQFNAPYSAILGGNLNLVRSNAGWATVLGGVESVAGAPFAIAAGHGAKAEHSGSIVLADGQYASFVSSNANEFAVRAAGGVRFDTGGRGVWVDGKRLGAVDPGGGGAGTSDITPLFTLSGEEPGRAVLRGVNESPGLLSTGVRGEATASTGITIGVFGLNGSSEGTAVFSASGNQPLPPSLHVDPARVVEPQNGAFDHPFRAVRQAVDRATRGTVISIAAGEYVEGPLRFATPGRVASTRGSVALR